MKIILKKEVANLGEAGDVVEVKSGYGRNYLIPQGFACAATQSALKQLEETKRQRAHKEAKLIADAEALAAKIEAIEGVKPQIGKLDSSQDRGHTCQGGRKGQRVRQDLRICHHRSDRRGSQGRWCRG